MVQPGIGKKDDARRSFWNVFCQQGSFKVKMGPSVFDETAGNDVRSFFGRVSSPVAKVLETPSISDAMSGVANRVLLPEKQN